MGTFLIEWNECSFVACQITFSPDEDEIEEDNSKKSSALEIPERSFPAAVIECFPNQPLNLNPRLSHPQKILLCIKFLFFSIWGFLIY